MEAMFESNLVPVFLKPEVVPCLVKSSREECFVPSLKIQVMKENPKIHPFITVIWQLWHLS